MAAPAVTGFEEQRRKLIVEEFSRHCDVVEVDVMGNVIGTMGDGERSMMLAGHYDQLGFMVKYVDYDGFAAFANVGGWDKRVAYGTRVKIWVGDGPEDYLVGTVAVKAAHLTDQKVKSTHDCNQCHHVHAPLKYIIRARQITGLVEKEAAL